MYLKCLTCDHEYFSDIEEKSHCSECLHTGFMLKNEHGVYIEFYEIVNLCEFIGHKINIKIGQKQNGKFIYARDFNVHNEGAHSPLMDYCKEYLTKNDAISEAKKEAIEWLTGTDDCFAKTKMIYLLKECEQMSLF